ncbi:Crp/Fnr family transcriptional regulator [Desulfonema magnum]|uniref:Cyclic nucleotide-binding domain-containing protein n=1 Tax=Desulfonema magnum TaxID=45655 RepID=A0A975BWN7_9BACT|nr:Crp/Fnr family transcriptional regulator [Desulfonema magnum]QTA92897.1 Cyclic nucleotide-binding domain-containing protein [Desulfonema magnum]
MVDPNILKSIPFFEELSDEMIERLVSVAQLQKYETGDYLNKRKKAADYFYIILEGEISLQMESLTGKTVRLETISVGGAIGFSSLIEMEKKAYLSDAKTLTPVTVLRFLADDLTLLFYQDFELGFLIMKKIALVAKRRLMYRTHPIPKV